MKQDKKDTCKIIKCATSSDVEMLKPLATLPVFFLKAKPRMQIFLSVMVLKRHSTILWANLILEENTVSVLREKISCVHLWKLLKLTTWDQYSATSGRFKHSLM